jgi:hypothetical protein
MAIGASNSEDLASKYLGTAYDDIKFVADNLDAILAVSVDIDAVNDAVALADADVVLTNADAISTAADVLLTAANAIKAGQWATEAEDVQVESGLFSAMHWAIKAEADANSINSILDTPNTFTMGNTYDDEIVLSNTANQVSPLKMTSTGAVGIRFSSGGQIVYLGVDTNGDIRFGTNANVTGNPIVLTTADINTAAIPLAASILTVATSATIGAQTVHHDGNAGISTVDWSCKDLVVANTMTIGGLTPFTTANANNVAFDYAVKDLVVAGTASITGVIVAGAVPTLDTHLCNKLYVDSVTATASATYADNVVLGLGDNQDLQLSHNGVSSLIDNTNGHLVISNSDEGKDINFSVKCDDGNIDTLITLQAGTSDNSALVIRYGDVQKFVTAVDGVEVAGVVSGSVAPTDVDHLTRKDYVDTELNNQTHTMSEVSGNVPVSQVPVAVNNASSGAGFGGFRYTTEDGGATLNLFTT